MPEPASLDNAIAHMVKLKNEHRPILSRIAGDPGMSIETRRILIEHLYEEEDEHMAEISALRVQDNAAGGATEPPPTSAADAGPTLTVGSLRPTGAHGPSLGNLRRSTPWPHAQKRGGTVGSLRPY